MASKDIKLNQLIKFLEENNHPYKIGIINNDVFFECDEFDNKDIYVNIKEYYYEKFLKKLNNIGFEFKEDYKNEYNALLNIKNTEHRLFIVFVVDSHIQIPKCILMNYKSKDDKLYYIDCNNTLKRSSTSLYNSCFGYYPLWFEKYLSDNYETLIGNICKKMNDFVNGKIKNVTFNKINIDIEKIYKMTLFRNPSFVKEFNKQSYTSVLFKNGYNSIDIAEFFEKFNLKVFKNHKILLMVNDTDEGLITLKTLFSDIVIHKGYLSAILPLNPKYAIMVVPDEYYFMMMEKYGYDSYMVINDLKILHDVNNNIYKYCLKNKIDVIGIKEDLEKLKV